ncbi:hypothetical protein Afil01_22450 [Actinorhabdospora filicis]|uniref:Bacteriophage T5 Orf172 DNA-binding domain-containing protein n=1 Tax=Actinorhabdospora filicis TaxID=1785913 RepID=A0A9W6W8X7_9ACTN|nr:hypothetical protein Afil01_22450 [Actinorhabdospora filicis]
MFGKGRRLDAVEAENRALWTWARAATGVDAESLATQAGVLSGEVASLGEQIRERRAALAALKRQVVATEDIAVLQEAGIYEYSHPLEDAVAYKAELDTLRDAYKTLARNGGAVAATTSWTVNNSAAEGRRMVRDFSKLMLRAYNAEADTLVRGMRPYKLQSALDRLHKTVETIAKLGKTMNIHITPEYHRLRQRELSLTSDHLAKLAEEKERRAEERARQREEEKAAREFEREKERLRKEHAHYARVLARYDEGDEAAREIHAKLAELDAELVSVESREANIRAGYVYVISNLGAFGESMVKVGLTRRLDPLDRVRELGDASVPFRFDVHALIFSDDAVGLETRLHQELADRRVNRVNLRREFFHATPAEVREILQRVDRTHQLEYHEEAEAEEWRISRNAGVPSLD